MIWVAGQVLRQSCPSIPDKAGGENIMHSIDKYKNLHDFRISPLFNISNLPSESSSLNTFGRLLFSTKFELYLFQPLSKQKTTRQVLP